MGKKMKLPALFKNKDPTRQPWQWPSCKHPKTLSFRAGDHEVFKTVNLVFFDPNDCDELEMPESWFTNSSESASCTTTESDQGFDTGEESLEMVVRGAHRSERLFFEPGGDTSSILEKAKPGGFQFEETSVVVAMVESDDPCLEFRRSMEEMVETHGLKDWECLEELLGWYLKVNGFNNHGFIIAAFIHLLVALAPTATTTSDSTSSSSPLSSTEGNNHEIEEEQNTVLP